MKMNLGVYDDTSVIESRRTYVVGTEPQRRRSREFESIASEFSNRSMLQWITVVFRNPVKIDDRHTTGFSVLDEASRGINIARGLIIPSEDLRRNHYDSAQQILTIEHCRVVLYSPTSNAGFADTAARVSALGQVFF